MIFKCFPDVWKYKQLTLHRNINITNAKNHQMFALRISVNSHCNRMETFSDVDTLIVLVLALRKQKKHQMQ